MDIALVILAGYLLGSFPSGYLIGRLHGIDIRRVGDGNVGMMNVYRSLGPAWGFLCFALDIGKAAGAVALARWVDAGDGATMAAGAAALAGHRYPVTLRFKGGRSATSAAGVMLGIAPVEMAGPVVLGAAIVALTRSAVAALAAGFSLLLVLLLVRQQPVHIVIYAIAVPVYAGINDTLDRRSRRTPANVPGGGAAEPGAPDAGDALGTDR